MIDFYYSPLELALLIMSMAFCTMLGVILGYKLTKYETKKAGSMFNDERVEVITPFPKKTKKAEETKKSSEDDNIPKIKIPKNMEW
jgi:hypothetical protein